MTDFRTASVTRGIAFSNDLEYLLQTQFALTDRNFDQMSDTDKRRSVSLSVKDVGARRSVQVVHQERSEQPLWTAVHSMARYEDCPSTPDHHVTVEVTSPDVDTPSSALNTDQQVEVRSKSNLFQRMGKALRGLLFKNRGKKPCTTFAVRPPLNTDRVVSHDTFQELDSAPPLLPKLAPNLIRTHSQNLCKSVTRAPAKIQEKPESYNKLAYAPGTQDLFLHRTKRPKQVWGYMSRDGSLLFDSPQGHQARLARFVGLSQEDLPHLDPHLFKDFDSGPEGFDRPNWSSSGLAMQAKHCASTRKPREPIDEQRRVAEAFLQMEYEQGGMSGCMRKKRAEQTHLNNYIYQVYSPYGNKTRTPKLTSS
ncbi:hypothetical protein BDV96DRAFT_642070 [Lophiotrema nucula]|uniref:Uncharacterized protein n=1 Tax=Lophiotrema nucula TaxID=690887 RepID=A0A6A5ZMJ7_9PLEO|nr:hypothetical protein BDV96DRAFT_642070 [Lophiotrema nucula]